MVDGPNMYNFCGGDPVNRMDPMGLKWVWNGKEWVWHEDGRGRTPKPNDPPKDLEAAKIEFREAILEQIYWLQLKQMHDAEIEGWRPTRRAGDNTPNNLLADTDRLMKRLREGGHACGVCHGTYEDNGYSRYWANEERKANEQIGVWAERASIALGLAGLAKVGIEVVRRGGTILLKEAAKGAAGGTGGLALAGAGAAGGGGLALSVSAAEITAIARALGISLEEALAVLAANAGNVAVATAQAVGPEVLHRGIDAVEEALESGALSKTTAGRAGISGNRIPTDDHHFLPKAFKKFFADRGLDVEKFKGAIDKTLHEALHSGGGPGRGGGWYSDELISFLKNREAALGGRNLTSGEVLEATNEFLEFIGMNGYKLAETGVVLP